MQELPGRGRCLELLTPSCLAAPSFSKLNKRPWRRGRRRSQESRRLHSHSSPSGSRQGARPLGGVLAVGVGAQRERPFRDTLLSYPRHGEPAGLWTQASPQPPLLGLRECGAPRGTGEPLQVSRECPPASLCGEGGDGVVSRGGRAGGRGRGLHEGGNFGIAAENFPGLQKGGFPCFAPASPALASRAVRLTGGHNLRVTGEWGGFCGFQRPDSGVDG